MLEPSITHLQPSLNAVAQGKAVDTFTPNAGGQARFFLTKAHEIILAGGNSSGKTYCGLMMCAWHILPELDKHGKPTNKTIHPHLTLRIPSTGIEGWISTWSLETQADIILPLYEKILGPYDIRREMKKGALDTVYFDGVSIPSRIHFKQQAQRSASYAGPKKAFVFLDEPHSKAIYREARARLFRSGGYMWTCLTPIVDEDQPMDSQNVLWMRDEIIEPWERDPDNYPLRDVIYVDVEENYDYIPGDTIDQWLEGMSPQERNIRKTGSFVMFAGRNCFDKDVIVQIRTYLEARPEESSPEFGTIHWLEDEADNWKAEFVPDSRIHFPYKPTDEWAFKIWERHVDGQGLQLCPRYLITVDVAEGKPGGDYTCAYVFRKDNKKVVASLHGHITEEELAKQLWLLGHYYNSGSPDYEPAELAIEIRNYGSNTQKYLLNGYAELGVPQYPYHMFYQRPTPSDAARGVEFAHAPGWDTTSSSRKDVISGMRMGLVICLKSILDSESRYTLIPDLGMMKEALGFILNKKGKYEGSPDDRLFAFGIGHHILGGSPMYRQMKALEEEASELLPEDVKFYLKERESGLVTVRFNLQGQLDKLLERPANEGNLQF